MLNFYSFDIFNNRTPFSDILIIGHHLVSCQSIALGIFMIGKV
ncbi:hypothetical protein HMPREF9412_6140 [Paenibacillus sp. HGF5]|nr:hypothetical protein HMPREF9412_6140 [Paenibacillus sp. HGF5]